MYTQHLNGIISLETSHHLDLQWEEKADLVIKINCMECEWGGGRLSERISWNSFPS